MQHFQHIDTVDVSRLVAELDANGELWGQHGLRKTFDGTPHAGMTDIWVRYNSLDRLDPSNRAAFNEEHVPVWYPAWDALPSMRPIIFNLMARVQGEMLGGVLITKIPPGEEIRPHRDDGWHVQYYKKFYVSLRSAPGAVFGCDDGVLEELTPRPGEIYLFDNRKNHWVHNDSDQDRITLIVCIRTEMFGRE